MDIDTAQSRALRGTVPFADLIGVDVVESSKEEVRGRIAWDPGKTTAGGALHGGLLMSLADTCAATCAFLNLPEDAAGTSTIEFKANFFRAVTEGHVDAVARALHVGRSTIVLEVDLTDAEGRPVGKTIQTQAVLRPGGTRS